MKKIGLSTEEAIQAKEKYGDNSLPSPARQTFGQKLVQNLGDPIIKILILALLVNVVFAYMGHADWLETIGIFVAIVLATMVSTWSEYSNENAFRKLQEEAGRIACKVWRDGEPEEISINEIVKGDAVQLESGDKIPADGVLISGSVKLDQSTLNGESEAAKKEAAPEDFIWNDEVEFMDPFRLYRGSVVVEGQGLMRAEETGMASVYGELTQNLKEDDRESPLKLKLKNLAHKISYFGYGGGILIAIAVMLHNIFKNGGLDAYMAQPQLVMSDFVQAIILSVIIIVMAVPEGLPLMIAIVSSLNMKKMLEDKVLVRKLTGIETAGSLNLLFTDKTGTITRGQLEVISFITGDMKEYGSFAELQGDLRELTYQNIVLNTSAVVTEGSIVGGNITEQALNNYIGDYRSDENSVERLLFVPFNSSNKYSFANVQVNAAGASANGAGSGANGAQSSANGAGSGANGASVYVLAKGAPEKLVSRCDFYMNEAGEKVPFTAEQKKALDDRMIQLAGRAIRMLALCSMDAAVKEDVLPEKGLILEGVLAIRDDVRPEAVEAIHEVQSAGVQVVMITGDRKETAVAIAKEAGLLQNETDQVWTSKELGEMTDDEVRANLKYLRVVSRALPMDKLRLVKLAQGLNLVTGMTGDGVNDSPALKKADVGFAMGSGTEVAKEAGDIVILDDNFLSIRQAILYGRTIYNSICKFIMFQLSINFSAVAINFIAPFVGIEKPLTIIQILWINLVMDTLAALAFGGEPALLSYLKEEPKKRSASIVSPYMLTTILVSGIYMTLVAIAFYKNAYVDSFFRSAPDHIYTYTGFFCAYIFMAVANGFNVRTYRLNIFENITRNRAFLRVMALIILVQIALTYFGGKILRTAPLNMEEWLVVIAAALSIIFVGFLRKLFSSVR